MSETEHEHDDGNPDEEHDAPIQGDDEDEAEHEETQTPAEAAAADGSAEIAKKLEAATKSYHTRISNILGEDMESHICPTCDGFGFADVEAAPEVELARDESKEECPVCHGYGQLITPSRNPDHTFAVCVRCSGQGWVVKEQPQANPYQNVTPMPTAAAAQSGTLLPDGRFLPFGSTEPITIGTPA